jgi:hypothetical protein
MLRLQEPTKSNLSEERETVEMYWNVYSAISYVRCTSFGPAIFKGLKSLPLFCLI